jgi:hypothetical protein
MNCFMILNERMLIKLTKGETKLVIWPTFEYQRRICVCLNKEYDQDFVDWGPQATKDLRLFGKTHLKAAANSYLIKASGKSETCKSCERSKAKLKKANTLWDGSSNVQGERLNVDITSKKVRVLEDPSSWHSLWMIK